MGNGVSAGAANDGVKDLWLSVGVGVGGTAGGYDRTTDTFDFTAISRAAYIGVNLVMPACT